MVQQSTPGYLFEGNENTNQKKNMCTPVFTAVLFTIAKMWQ